MRKHAQIVERMREGGHRLTPQRVMVLSAIEAADGHTTADEIYQRVRKEYPYIDMATIYRTLHLLKRLKLVTEIPLEEGSAQYELASQGGHVHMFCRQCKATLDLDRKYLEPLKHILKKELSFVADIDNFAISGLCHDCYSKKSTVA